MADDFDPFFNADNQNAMLEYLDFIQNTDENDPIFGGVFAKNPSFFLSHNPPTLPNFDKQNVQQQDFPFPKPLVTYLTAIHNLNRDDGYIVFQNAEWSFQVFESQKEYSLGPNFDFKQIFPQIWIQGTMNVRDLMIPTFLSSSVLPKIFQCNVTALTIRDQEIFFDEFIFLTTDVVDICIDTIAKIKNTDGSIVLVEKLVEHLPKLQRLKFEIEHDNLALSAGSVKNLIKLENFKNLQYIYFSYVNEVFDIETFSDYMIENRNVEYTIIISYEDDERIKPIREKVANFEFQKPPQILY